MVYYMFIFNQEMFKIWQKQYSKCVKGALILYILFYFISQNCIFKISAWFSIQYITYYIPLESSNSPLSNGMVVQISFLHIIPLGISSFINFVFKYLGHLHYNQCYSKYYNIAGKISYLMVYILLLSTYMLLNYRQTSKKQERLQ